ncbi:PREDICTED: AP-5 complex subunit zeta-1 [Thamnophis sirtalis]|uniref:AP-5 complex subunit zeta-1 n=1 Tax=Thamnophis sirtalis TaxID=35019 RepID=A0A6I9XZ84_9SAUR|nr:PREDICTED: AP-5 complex subunit zeta-1 [Thamnophis sirtalis]
MGQHVVKILEGRLPEDQSARPLLPILSKVIGSAPLSLNEDQINLISKRMVDWLRYASLQQGATPASGGFFNPRGKQPGPITEVDGTVATDFFTVLSVGQNYTEDQWLNMQAFSMLRKWLLCYRSDTTSNPNSDDKSEVDGSLVSMVSVTSTSSRLLSPRERLREKAFEYCQRLLEQSNRRALKKTDGELQKACLVEAITIMDIICQQDSSYVYRSLSCLKNLHGRISGDPSGARLLIPIAQFFLNHSETAAVDSEAVYRHLFTKVPAQLFHNLMLAYEFLQFCRQNVGFFTENLDIFRQSTPNLFKFLAWNSPALTIDYTDLLPALLSPENALEMFHLLLDLPCLTAALDTQLRSFECCRSTCKKTSSGSCGGKSPKRFLIIVWAIGEYASVTHDKRCTAEQINTFFDVLEAMLFEITQLRPSASIPKSSPRVIAVLMTALTKLASRSQDLIPRVCLFLSKMKIFIQSPAVSSIYCAEEAEAILTRATELMNLLKMPSVAQFVLRPSSEDLSHQETHLPLLLAMKMTSQLLEGGTGSVPG